MSSTDTAHSETEEALSPDHDPFYDSLAAVEELLFCQSSVVSLKAKRVRNVQRALTNDLTPSP